MLMAVMGSTWVNVALVETLAPLSSNKASHRPRNCHIDPVTATS